MMGIKDAHGYTFKSKKALKEYGAAGEPVKFIETSMFGPEFKGAGEYTVVGPNPFNDRRWYAQVTVDAERRVVKVK